MVIGSAPERRKPTGCGLEGVGRTKAQRGRVLHFLNEKENHFQARQEPNQALRLSRGQLPTANRVLGVWRAGRPRFLSRVVCRGGRGAFHEGVGLAVRLALHLRLVVGNLEDRGQVRRAPDVATRSQGRGDRPCCAGCCDGALRWPCRIPSARQPRRLSRPLGLRRCASHPVVGQLAVA